MTRRELLFQNFDKYKEETADRIQNGIEANRKGWARVTVTDRDGNSVPGATVSFRQTGHEFKFGANLFMLDELETDEKNQKYRDLFANVFNYATLPFYWSDLEPVQGKPRYEIGSPKLYRRPAPDLCLQYCREKGIEPKCHCLTYVNFTPDWVPEDVTETKRLLQKRYHELSERYADEIRSWEVINETLCHDNPKHEMPFFKIPNLVNWNFSLAEKYFPHNRLIINEATPFVWHNYQYDRSQYYLVIKEAIEHGAKIDSIGCQFHLFHKLEDEAKFTKTLFNPLRLYDVMDTYSRFNLPMQITETTIPAYTPDAENEDIQADLLEQYYSIWFSHPAMEAIIYWNLPDGYAAFAPQGDMKAGENYFRGGLLRFDFSKKPSYERLEDLVHHRWHSEGRVETNGEGIAKFKGFFGDYDLSVKVGNNIVADNIKMTKIGKNEFKIVLP